MTLVILRAEDMCSKLVKVAMLIATLLVCSRGEVFTALIHMEGLVSAEEQLFGALNAYISKEKER